MDVVIIFNGLGNQMSQYAFYLAKKRKSSHTKAIFDYGNSCNHNGLELDKLFSIKLPHDSISKVLLFLYKASKNGKYNILTKLLGVRILYEPRNYDYLPEMLEPGPRGINFYLGGWHTERYFKCIEPELNKLYKFPENKDEDFIQWKNIIEQSEESVSIHVRRGDYVHINPNDYYQFGNVSTLKYYSQAIEYIKTAYPQSVFFVFSDDIKWCREQFGDGFNYVDCNNGHSSWRDMYLITQCKHHINANSTFSWWGAWLNNSPGGIVIRPQWFIRGIETKDFYPESWVELK